MSSWPSASRPTWIFCGTQTAHRTGARIEVYDEDLQTGEAGVYAGGDAVSGPESIINAIAHGRRAAAAIDRYLGGKGDIDEILSRSRRRSSICPPGPAVQPREAMPLLKPWQRLPPVSIRSKPGMRAAQIAAESRRCLRATRGGSKWSLIPENCKECGYCAEVCSVDTFGPGGLLQCQGLPAQGSANLRMVRGLLQMLFCLPRLCHRRY